MRPFQIKIIYIIKKENLRLKNKVCNGSFLCRIFPQVLLYLCQIYPLRYHTGVHWRTCDVFIQIACLCDVISSIFICACVIRICRTRIISIYSRMVVWIFHIPRIWCRSVFVYSHKTVCAVRIAIDLCVRLCWRWELARDSIARLWSRDRKLKTAKSGIHSRDKMGWSCGGLGFLRFCKTKVGICHTIKFFDGPWPYFTEPNFL